MKTTKCTFVTLITLVAGSALTIHIANAKVFAVQSNDIASGKAISEEYVFNGIGCTGQNTSPEIHWTGAPEETKSFALTVYDPDAPTGSGFWHWVVINIPVATQSLEKGWKSDGENGVEITSDFGAPQYGGPCPPAGEKHRYAFTVHALNTEKIDLPAGATNAFARFMIEAATIRKAKFKSYYKR